MTHQDISSPIKISVITVCYNAADFITDTIQSVVNQTFGNYEFIIIDGGSTDGTVDIINQYTQHLKYFISEPDKGIADAMNKGIKQASGDYLLFLHADDYLYSKDALLKASHRLEKRYDIVTFGIKLKTTHGLRTKNSRMFSGLTNFKTNFWHQGVFCKKTLFNTLGAFDTHFKIAMDYDFFLRAYRANATMKIYKPVLSVMREGGISSKKDWSSLRKRFKEEKNIHQKNCNSIPLKILYTIYWPLYINYRRCIYLKHWLNHDNIE